jgi:hypothetical protein
MKRVSGIIIMTVVFNMGASAEYPTFYDIDGSVVTVPELVEQNENQYHRFTSISKGYDTILINRPVRNLSRVENAEAMSSADVLIIQHLGMENADLSFLNSLSNLILLKLNFVDLSDFEWFEYVENVRAIGLSESVSVDTPSPEIDLSRAYNLEYLEISDIDFPSIPRFVGPRGNLRYINMARSRFAHVDASSLSVFEGTSVQFFFDDEVKLELQKQNIDLMYLSESEIITIREEYGL